MKGVRDKVYSAWKAGKPPSPAIGTLGIRVRSIEESRTVLEMNVDERLHNLSGTMHGGVMVDIADAAMGIAFSSTLEPGETFTTVELKINFLRPVREAMLRAEGKVVHRGRTIGYVECDVVDENGKLIAKSNSTCLVLRGEKAAGR